METSIELHFPPCPWEAWVGCQKKKEGWDPVKIVKGANYGKSVGRSWAEETKRQLEI